MLLFRYFGSHAFETLRDGLLKAATVSSLNDPFELLYQLTGTMTPAKAKRYLKKRLRKDDFFVNAQNCNPAIRSKKDLKRFMAVNRDQVVKNLVSVFDKLKAEDLVRSFGDRMLRLVCFTESTVDLLDEILIWSHYANRHRGVRIGFEFPDGIISPFKIVQVQYRKKRVSVDLTHGSEEEWVKEAFNESIRVKSAAWEYEREYRMLSALHLCVTKQLDTGGNSEFIPFKKEWVKHVDMGLRSSVDEIQKMKEFLKKEYPHVICRKAIFHRTDYALEYEPT